MFIFSCLPGYTQQRLNIHVEKAGTLGDLLPNADDIEFIKITGYLNDIDFEAFQKLKYHGFSLDLSEAIFDEIPYRAFYDSNFGLPLREIVLPESLTSISEYAFNECRGLTVVDLSRCSNLKFVGTGAFSWCRNLLSIDFSTCYELKYLGGYSWNEKPEQFLTHSIFEECSKLQEVILPPNLEVIGVNAFISTNYPTILSRIEIPATVRDIQAGAFAGNKLTEIKMKGITPPCKFYGYENETGNHPFDGVDLKKCILRVPLGCKGSYKSARVWKDFFNIEEYDPNEGSLITHTILVSYNEGGYVKLNNDNVENESSISVSTGTDVQVSMFPQAGYHIKQVQLGNDDVTGQLSNNILTISSISTNKNIKVIFEEDTPATHSVKVTYSPGGSVKVNDKSVTSGQSTTATASTDVKVEIIPQAGYLIKQVRLGNDDVTGQLIHNILTIPSILSDKEISITFEKGASITYAVKVTYSTGGSVMVNDQLVTSGQSVTATASTDVKVMIMPQDGYHIRQVKLGDEDVIDKLINKELTIPSISADKEIKITFVKEIYTLRVTYTEGGTVRVSKNVGGYKEFASGQSAIFKTSDIVDVSINSKTGYRVKQVLLGNTDVTDKINNPGGREMLLTLSFSSSSLEEVKDQEVAVTFEKITYSVKVTYSNGGRAQVNGQSVASGNACSADIFTDVKVMMIPDKGYRLREVKLGFMDVMNQVNNNVLTIPSISENKEITIKFAYILKVYSSGSGSIKVNGEIIQSGSIVPDTGTKVEFIPNEGYYTAKVMLNSKDITSELVGNSFTVSTLPSYSSLSVTFKTLPTYKLSIDMPSNEASIKIGDRVITESTRISDIKEESSICINFQPSKYYKIKSVILEDKDITDQIQNDSYTIKSMKSNLTLKIEYIRKQYVLLIDIQGTDEIKFNGKDVTNGSSITTNSGYNRIDISSEYYLIKQVLLDNEIIEKGPSGYIEISMDSDKKLTIIAELREKREVSLTSEEPGTLASHLSEEDMKMVTDLNISGEIDQRDFLVLNQMQSLYKLNLIVTIREYNNYPANTIPENAFHNNKTIKMIDLSNSIEAIGKQAFWGSAISHIKKYDENLTKIGEEAFKDCQYLITIPSTYNVPVIEKSTFENCSSLSALPSLYNLIEVKESAFRNCKNLSVDLGSSLERIGNYAFENVKEINTLPVFQGEAKLSYIGTDAFKGTQSNRFDFSNYPYLQELPNFEGSSNLNHITFPPNVKEVPANTFKGCTSLQEVYMNNKIERIAENAFCDSNGISYLYVPVNNTPEISTNSFSEFCYINAALIVPTDYMYFYRHHAVWSKFTEIKHLGNDSHRQISATISEGGHVLSKAEEDMYPNNIFDNGSYNSISYPTSSRVEFIVEIDKGYSIESIILNGEDITKTLDNNNEFIIPNLMVDSHLEVKFKKEEDPTGTETIHINKHIYLSGSNQLVFSDFKIGTHAIVFDASGRMIKQITIRNNMERIDLPGRGIYFVRVENKSTKIIL